MADMRKIVMVGAPLVAVGTVALGLRVGAGGAVRAAVIHAAPRGRDAATFAWQMGTFLEDRGVREAVPMRGLTVTARSKGGASASWHGESNADGIAEIRLDLPDVRAGDPVTVDVRAEGESAPLAEGSVAWEAPQGQGGASGLESTYVRPTRRDGEVALDVAIYGERLTPGYPTPLWVRATDRVTGGALAGVTIEAEPEPGLTLDGISPEAARATTCASGFAELWATAIVHVVGLSLHARAANGKTGDFFAGLPVAAGAYAVAVPPRLAPASPAKLDIVAPNARTVVYAEIDDDRGRIFAAALPLTAEAGGMPHATLDVPPLGPGLHWLTTSGDPRGAETIAGATVARPFHVAAGRAEEACAENASLATLHTEGFSRWLALDGFAGRSKAAESRRGRGLLLAFASLAIAAALEALLIFRGARRATNDLARAAAELDPNAPPDITHRTSAGSLAIGLLLALLGFVLLAALLAYRG